jgi:predicted RecB family endonuclease
MLAFSKNDNIASALKTSLARKNLVEQAERSGNLAGQFPDEKAIKAKVEKIELTDELIKLSNEELYAELQKANLNTAQLQTLEDYKSSKEKNVEILLKELNLSSEIAQNEFKINDAIAKRKDLIADASTAIGMSDKQLAHNQKMRSFADKLAAAQRLTAFGPGFKTEKEQEDFKMREKQFTLASSAITLRKNAKSAVNKKIKERTDLGLQQQIAQERITALKGGAKPTSVNEQKKLEALLIKQQQNLAFIDHEIKNINESTEVEISNAQKLLEEEKKRLKLKREHETGPGAFGRGARDAQKRIVEQAETMEHRLGGELTNQFRNGLVDGMQAAINKADDLSDVMNNIAMNFLGAIQKAYLGKAADAIVGALPFSSGGGVRKYSKGGGVPAMVTNGEYVMGKEAVNRYGGGFMHRLNAGGKLPGYSTGGGPKPGSALAANFGGGEGYATGRRYQSQAMSGFFYSGQAGNVGLQEDTQYTKGIIQERMRKEAEKKAKKRALMQMIVGTALSVGVGALANAGIGAMAESGTLGGGAQQKALFNAAPEGTFGPMDPSSARRFGGFSARLNQNFGGDGSWSWNKSEQDGELFRGGRVGK